MELELKKTDQRTNMDYIALAMQRKEIIDITPQLQKEENKYDLKFVFKKENVKIDVEVNSGVTSFLKALKLSAIKIIKKSTQDKNTTSSEIDQELVDLFFKRSDKCNLIEFLINNKKCLPKKYFLIFAFEWYANEPCRLEKINVQDLQDYFTNHNSWYLWLYNYVKNVYSPDLDTPLVLEINND